MAYRPVWWKDVENIYVIRCVTFTTSITLGKQPRKLICEEYSTANGASQMQVRIGWLASGPSRYLLLLLFRVTSRTVVHENPPNRSTTSLPL